MSDHLDRDLGSLLTTIRLFASDVESVAELSERGDTQFLRRMYVRAVFARVEGNLSQMLHVMCIARDELSLSTKETETLKSARTLKEKVRSIVEIFPRLYGNTFSLDVHSPGWAEFQKATKSETA